MSRASVAKKWDKMQKTSQKPILVWFLERKIQIILNLCFNFRNCYKPWQQVHIDKCLLRYWPKLFHFQNTATYHFRKMIKFMFDIYYIASNRRWRFLLVLVTFLENINFNKRLVPLILSELYQNNKCVERVSTLPKLLKLLDNL